MTDHRVKAPQPEILSLSIIDAANTLQTLDFERYNYHGFPNQHTQKRIIPRPVRRTISAKQIYDAFRASDYTQAYKGTLFRYLRKYVAFCDTHALPLFSEHSVGAYGAFTKDQCANGRIKNSTYTAILSGTKRVFLLLDLSGHAFDTLPTLGKNQCESWQGYSDDDLKKLLPLLRGFFKQAARSFLSSPQTCLMATGSEKRMHFYWKGKSCPVYSLVSKMMACAVYLMSYYTWANTTTLLSLPRPECSVSHLKEEWYLMPAFKRRAFKIITVRMGAHDDLNIPIYSMDFFHQLLEISKKISPARDSRLFMTNSIHGLIGLSSAHLQCFNHFITRHFHLTDDRGDPLVPGISRFRTTGSQLLQFHHSHSEAARLLGNTPDIIRKHYSNGNPYDNQAMMQEAVSVLSDKAKYGETTEQSRQRQKDILNVEILTYEKLRKLSAPPVRQAHGSYCQEPFGVRAEKFIRRFRNNELLSTEKYACSDLLQCFSCPHQVIVAEVTDIWCLLSFKECIEESLCRHVDIAHYQKNYSHILRAIEKILTNIQNDIVKKAIQKMSDDGPHPLWQDPSSLYPSGTGGMP